MKKFKRTKQDQLSWEEVLQWIKENEIVTTNSRPNGSLKKEFKTIKADVSSSRSLSQKDFPIFHVETLVDQAADLLDNCRRERAKWEQLAERKLVLELELGEHVDLDEIHNKEEKNGYYDVPTWYYHGIARSESEMSDRVKQIHSKILSHHKNHHHFATHKEIVDKHRGAGTLQAHPAWYPKGGEPFAVWEKAMLFGKSKEVHKHSAEIAGYLAKRRLKQEKFEIDLREIAARYEKKAVEERASALREKAAWELKNRDYRKDRAKLARKYNDLKAKAFTAEDSIFNLNEQVLKVKRRFDSDFHNAYVRLQAVETGMKQIYGVTSPLPAGSGTSKFLDECQEWTQEIIQWLIRFGLKEQSTVFTISLRSKLGDEFESLAGGVVQFSTSPNDFLERKCLRLRGVSVSTIEDSTYPSLWRSQLQPDKTGQYYHLSGSVGELSQQAVPNVFSETVTSYFGNRSVNKLGANTLHNVSPLGTWSFQLKPYDADSDRFEGLKDVLVQFHTVYRASER